jgi:hypothetical protein
MVASVHRVVLATSFPTICLLLHTWSENDPWSLRNLVLESRMRVELGIVRLATSSGDRESERRRTGLLLDRLGEGP